MRRIAGSILLGVTLLGAVTYYGARARAQEPQPSPMPFAVGDTVTMYFPNTRQTCGVAGIRGAFVSCAAAPETWYNTAVLSYVRVDARSSGD
jgi:hypothetical protein